MNKTILLALTLAACGGGGKKADVEHPTPTPETKALPLGTTGFPGIDFGDTLDAVKADYPDAVVADDVIMFQANVGGRDASVDLQLTGDSVISVHVGYPDAFASMGDCKPVFDEVHTELNKSLGDMGEDNLAVFWNTGTADVELACNPNEDGTASLMIDYAIAETEGE